MDKAVVKAFKLLEILAESDNPLGVTQLAEFTDLGKSNVHRLLQTLQFMGYVSKTHDNQYAATLRVWELGSFVIARQGVREQARPYMCQLSEMTKETVHLAELHEFEVLYIDKIESKEPVRAYTQLGGRAPAYCTATGKAMLAYMSAQSIIECLSNAQNHTGKTIVNAERFALEAANVRQNRYAINRGEWRADVIGLGAPIMGQGAEVIAAIGLSAPASRVGMDELVTLSAKLVEYARCISLTMGCTEKQWLAAGQVVTPQALPGSSANAAAGEKVGQQ